MPDRDRDLDVDLDVHDTTLTTISIMGRCILAGFVGGHGSWVNRSGETVTGDIPEMSAVWEWPHAGDQTAVSAAYWILVDWRDTAARLQVTMAVGAPTIVTDGLFTVSLPRGLAPAIEP